MQHFETLMTDIGPMKIDLTKVIAISGAGDQRCQIYLLGMGQSYINASINADDLVEKIEAL